jgi:hypothetical protein
MYLALYTDEPIIGAPSHLGEAKYRGYARAEFEEGNDIVFPTHAGGPPCQITHLGLVATLDPDSPVLNKGPAIGFEAPICFNDTPRIIAIPVPRELTGGGNVH